MHASAAFLFPCPVAVLCGCSGHGGNPVKRGQDADYKKNLFQRTPSITLAEGKSCRRPAPPSRNNGKLAVSSGIQGFPASPYFQDEATDRNPGALILLNLPYSGTDTWS